MLLCFRALLVLASNAGASAVVVEPVYSLSGEHIFDGKTDAQCVDSDIGAGSALPMAGSSYTIEAWVMPEELILHDESLGIMGWGVPGYNQLNGFIFYLNSKSLRNIWWANDLQADLAQPLADGSYHHVAATWDGKTQRIFVDSVEVASKASGGYGVQKKDNFCIGVAWHRDGSRARFRGKIKDVKIWNIARDVAASLPTETSVISVEQMQPVQAVSPMYKVYKVHTQVGFLNIHSEPGDPFRMDNVVGRWSEGDVIKVKGEPLQTRFGPWLQTCKGWSIQIYDDFHWLRPLSPDEAPQQTIAHEHATSEKDKPKDDTVVTGDLASTHNVGNKFDYEGTLLLKFDIPESGDDFQVKLRAVLSKQWYKEALLVALQAYFGFEKVWFPKSAVRRLRTSVPETGLHFRAQGRGGALADGMGLKATVQGMLDAAGAGLTLHSVSVKWLLLPGVFPAQESGQSAGSWQLVWVALTLVIPSALLGVGAVVLCQRKQAAKQKGTSNAQQVHVDVLGFAQVVDSIPTLKSVDEHDAEKHETVGEDVSSESTADDDVSSEGVASSSASVSRTTSEEELGPALY